MNDCIATQNWQIAGSVGIERSGTQGDVSAWLFHQNILMYIDGASVFRAHDTSGHLVLILGPLSSCFSILDFILFLGTMSLSFKIYGFNLFF